MDKLLVSQPIYITATYHQLICCIHARRLLDKRLSLSPETTHRNGQVSAVRREVSLVAAAQVSDVAGAGVIGEVRSGSAVTANCADTGDARRSTGAGC